MSNPNVNIDRHKYVGGSDLPNILGLNAKYGKSIFEFAKEKAGIIPNSFNGNEYTKYGQLMEPVIRDFINVKYGVNYQEDTVIDTERNYRGNTDGIDVNAQYPILEVKTFGNELDIDYYIAQCQFYLEMFNQPRCLLVGYKRPSNFYNGVDYTLEYDNSYFNLEFDENNIVEYEIERDNSLWKSIENRIVLFQKGVAYLREHKEDYTEEKFNEIFYGKDVIEATNKVLMLEQKLLPIKDIEDDFKRTKEELYSLLDKYGILSLETENMRITKVAPTSYDTVTIDIKKLKEEDEETYNKYKVIKTTNKKGYVLITRKAEK